MKKPNYNKSVSKENDTNFGNLINDLFKEINKIRENPESFIEVLEKEKEYFKDEVIYRPNEDPLRTQEGVSAYDEAIEFLKEGQKLNPLVLDDRLSKACQDHVNDIGRTGAISHEGTKKETISDRVETYAEWDYVLCQNIDFGGKNVNEIIVSFITGDGDPNRTHRKNIFREDIAFVGLATGNHQDTEICTVVCFAGNVRDLGFVAPEVQNFISNHIKKLEEEKTNPKPKVIKTKFQVEDPDAPATAVSYTTFKKMKLVDGRAKHCTQRVYTLEDGTQHIVEVFDDLKIRCDTSIDNSKKKEEETN